MTSIQRQIALSLFSGIGAVNARKLVAYLGSVDAIFNGSKKEMQSIPGIGKKMIDLIISTRSEILERAMAEIEFIKKHQIETYFYLDKNYPKRLAQCADAPVIFYQKGKVDLNATKIISVVGTRKATDYGRERVQQLLTGLKNSGIDVIVVSGLAYGIDYAAHKESVANGLQTVGVVGHGLDTLYPSTHRSFVKEMLTKNGALLSDFPSRSKIDPGNFLRRNRIIAGLSDCTIVVESAKKGGALVTADIANSYNRDVFAFPGRATDTYSVGCNALIRENKAAMITSAEDLINFMGWEQSAVPKQKQLFVELSTTDKKIVEQLNNNEILSISQLSKLLLISLPETSALLLELEFKGVVKYLPGSRIKLA